MTAPPLRYFDNAATSHPKPPAVARAMLGYMADCGAPARGVHAPARTAARLVDQCRARIARLVNLTDHKGHSAPDHVVFGYNTTDALNLAVKGVLSRATTLRRFAAQSCSTVQPLHVIATAMEHNSILRPLSNLGHFSDLRTTILPADPTTGLIDPGDLRRAIRPGQTALVCINHASNVTGTIQDINALGRVCAEFGGGGAGTDDANALVYLIDAAQSLGHIPVDMKGAHADLLAFPGHKGLMGPTGTGGLCIRPGMEKRLDTIREGGTGSASEELTHPDTLPDKYEPGSHNTVGIIGLSEGVAWILERGIDGVRAHEVELLKRLFAELAPDAQGHCRGAPGLRLLGPVDIEQRVGVLSFVHDDLSSQDMAAILEASYGILTRAGLHCAPLVHEMLGTAFRAEGREPPGSGLDSEVNQTGSTGGLRRSALTGAVRLSLGPFITSQDIDYAAAALATICREHRETPSGPLIARRP